MKIHEDDDQKHRRGICAGWKNDIITSVLSPNAKPVVVFKIVIITKLWVLLSKNFIQKNLLHQHLIGVYSGITP